MRTGHVVEDPIELFDLMATVLELAEVPARHTHFARSLVPQLQGEVGDLDRAAFAEGGYDLDEPHCFEGRPGVGPLSADDRGIYYPKGLLQQEHPESVCRAVMVRTATHKLVYRKWGQCELYDLETDPRELDNLYGTEAVMLVQRTLEHRLLDWYLRTSDVVPSDANPRGLPLPT